MNRVAHPKRAVEFSYSDESFTREVVTDDDFAFVEFLAEDDPDWALNGWTASKDRASITVWLNHKV